MKLDSGSMVFDPHELVMITALLLQPVLSEDETNEAIASMEVWANAVAGRAVNGRDRYYSIYNTLGYRRIKVHHALVFTLSSHGLVCGISPRYLYNNSVYVDLRVSAAKRSWTALRNPDANKIKQSQYCAAVGSMVVQQKINRAQAAEHLRGQSWLNL